MQLGCQTWGANHDLQRKGFVMLMNAPHYCTQIPPWTRGLTNYLDDDWSCITNITPRFN